MFVTHVKNFNLTTGMLARKGDQVEKRNSAAAQAAMPKPPLFSILMSFTNHMYNCSASIFECKSGIRPALLPISSQADFAQLCSQPIAKKALNAIKKALAGGQASVVQPLDAGKMVMRRYDSLIQKCAGQDLRTRCVLPRVDLAPKVFEPEIFGSGACEVNIFWPAYGMMSANVILEGDVVIAGVHTDKLPGDTFEDKRTAAFRMTVDDIMALLQDGGFYVKFTGGTTTQGHSVIAIPSGFCIFQANVKARILRWPFVADESDMGRVRNTLKGMLDAFPALRQPCMGHAQLACHLGAN